MQGRPFLMPSPPGWGWAPISTSLLTLGVAASTLQKPSQGETRAAAWGLGQQARAVQGAQSPLCQEMHDGGGDASSSALHLLGLIFISVHGQPTLLLFVGPWLLFFCSLALVSPAAAIKWPGEEPLTFPRSWNGQDPPGYQPGIPLNWSKP